MAFLNLSKFWTSGRQNASYYKRLLFEINQPRLKLDCYLLKYVPGSAIHPHIDPSCHGHHYRLNIVLKKPRLGGVFKCSTKPILQIGQRVILFRPDLYTHELTTVRYGTRIVLSIGWICNIRK